MAIQTNRFRLQIAERGVGSLSLLALLRWALVVIFLWFGVRIPTKSPGCTDMKSPGDSETMSPTSPI